MNNNENSNLANSENNTNSKLQTAEIRNCIKCKTAFTGETKICPACLLRQNMYVMATSVNGCLNSFSPDQAKKYNDLQAQFYALTNRHYTPRCVEEETSTNPMPTNIVRSISTNIQTGTILLKSSTDTTILSITPTGNIDIYTPDLFTIDNIPVKDLINAYEQYKRIKEVIR